MFFCPVLCAASHDGRQEGQWGQFFVLYLSAEFYALFCISFCDSEMIKRSHYRRHGKSIGYYFVRH